jgi:uncharacterized protein (TIGR03435 family)
MMHLSGCAIAVLLGVGAVGVAVHAQEPSPLPVFDVASVKVNTSGSPMRGLGPEPGGFGAINVPLGDLVAFAYGIPPASVASRVLGGPEWIAGQRFNISAKAAAPRDRIALMVRALLIDRFKLQAHMETRDEAVYVLIVARPDRTLGSQLHPSEIDCAARREAARNGTPLPAAPGSRPVCTGRTVPGSITGVGLSLETLASALTRFAGRSVIDRTRVAGGYDYELTWTPDQVPEPRPGEPPLAIDPSGPSLPTALREQLGLELQPDRVPAAVVVIDHAELPGPD